MSIEPCASLHAINVTPRGSVQCCTLRQLKAQPTSIHSGGPPVPRSDCRSDLLQRPSSLTRLDRIGAIQILAQLTVLVHKGTVLERYNLVVFNQLDPSKDGQVQTGW